MGEVMPGVALALIDDGALDGAGPVLGLHREPELDAGRIGLRSGAITSACAAVEITLTGPRGRTARPGGTVDLVQVAAEAARRLPTGAQQDVTGIGQTVTVSGALHGGDVATIIPHVRLGVRRAGDAQRPDLHAGHLDVDESAIAVGVRVLVGAVLGVGER